MKRLKYSTNFIIIMSIIICVASLLVLSNYLNIKSKVQINYDVSTIEVADFDYTSLLELFDDISLENNVNDDFKVVNTKFKLSGSSLNDVVFTSNSDEENVLVSGATSISKNTDRSVVDLILDYGENVDNVHADSSIHFDENGNLIGTLLFDGVEYDVQDVMSSMYGENGVQECWFWFIFKIISVIVTVVVTAITAVDIYKYVTTEEVTLNGVLCIVAEGVVCAATSCVAGAVAGSMIKSGYKVLKKAKKARQNISVLLGRTVKQFDNECIKLVNSGKTYINKYFPNQSKLRDAYVNKKEFKSFNFTDSSKDDYIQIHHFVEQRQYNKFDVSDIHTDLNTVGITKKMHQKISSLYTSSKKHINVINEIFGKNYFDGKSRFRDFVGAKSYKEQYKIGVKVFEYFQKQGNNPVLRL